MDEDSIPSLSELSLQCVCCNLQTLCIVGSDGALRFCSCPVFPQELSDLLINTMAQEGVLNDRTIGVFRSTDSLRLKRVRVRSCRLSVDAFRQSLCCHRLTELDASRLHGDITISDVLQVLVSSQQCRQGLQRLNLTGVDLFSSSPDRSPSFSSLRALRSLCLAWTELNDSGLQDICSLPLLDSLDISGTTVTDLNPLLNLRSHLQYLTAHGLHQLDMSAASLLNILSRLDQLRHLDISNNLEMYRECPAVVVQLLESTDILPSLESLDVSGWFGINDDMVKLFVEARRMRFLGLLATRAGTSDFLSGEGNLKVAGDCNLSQVCEALRRYREKESFLQRALSCLSDLSRQTDVGLRPDILKLVCTAMKTHSESASLQLVAIQCIYILTDVDQAVGISLRLLGNVVHQLISTMKNCLKHEYIVKGCLLILCRNYILEVVPFNRYEAAKVIMSLDQCEHMTIQKISVSVLPRLISKLSVEEIVQLEAAEFIIKKLLSMVQQRASVGEADPTLKFALSALWNFTDESPEGCRKFLENQGLELYTEILETYFFDSGVQQKVLGLLNNIAEVEYLREQLMEEDLLSYIVTLMESPEVKVSYFAGGILAHLTSTSCPDWGLNTLLRDSVLSTLHSSVMSWTPPDQNMVSYRSFQAFYPLLDCSQPSGVQLWALWGIQLVIRHDVSLYSRMLQEEGGLDKLRCLTSDPDVHSDVQTLTLNILHLVETQQNCS